MKREIKRLQRLRDIFRQNTNNPAILEQNKLVEARKLIETVSVWFDMQGRFYTVT
jgi:CCR4-NOT transcriptional regulation complex NOT5 subunit